MVSCLFEFLCVPLGIFVIFLVILSAVNKSVGVRRSYVNLLLKIFEYGRLETKKAGQDVDEPQNSCDQTAEHALISRDNILLPTSNTNYSQNEDDAKDTEINFNFEKCLEYIKAGVESIIEDEVTSRFEAEQLRSWNLLTRTNRQYEFISWKITLIWMLGFWVRYFILMPLRIFVCFIGVLFAVVVNSIVAFVPFQFLRQPLAELAFKITFRIMTASLSAVVWLTLCTALVGYLKEGENKRRMVNRVLRHCFTLLSSAISAVIYYHNEENRPKCGICVANHTSPIDVLVLMCDTTYSLIGQRHGGFLGILQRALARASPHIWFERGEAKDRHAVAERLKQHVSDPNNPPILIFPEGTCINNTSVMQFKKGSFEVGGVIYPVAIKYDPRFGDAFWNSSKYSMMQYLYMMMTSWAIVCDVWYLPPMYRQEGESAIDFANRVKSVIAKQGGLVDLVWDGQLKRMKPKKEWKELQQVEFTKRLKGD